MLARGYPTLDELVSVGKAFNVLAGMMEDISLDKLSGFTDLVHGSVATKACSSALS